MVWRFRNNSGVSTKAWSTEHQKGPVLIKTPVKPHIELGNPFSAHIGGSSCLFPGSKGWFLLLNKVERTHIRLCRLRGKNRSNYVCEVRKKDLFFLRFFFFSREDNLKEKPQIVLKFVQKKRREQRCSAR